MSNVIASDVQGSYIDSPLITLFELEIDGSFVYFHSGVDYSLDDLQFVSLDGTAINTYTPLPITIDGMLLQADGAQARPTITMANVTTVFKNARDGLSNEDLIGKKLIRRQTFAKYLVGGTPGSSVGQIPVEFPTREYLIDRISAETSTFISFELAAPFDLEGITLPRRKIIGKYCSWAYQGYWSDPSYGGCTWRKDGKYVHGNDGNTSTQFSSYYFTEDDNPILLARSPDIYAAYSSSTTYNKKSIVLHNNKTWLSLYDNNLNYAPSASSSYWIECPRYTQWDGQTTYAEGDYVRYGATAGSETIWIALAPHLNQVPKTYSIYWRRGDVCGKSLNSCKSRFQAVPANRNTNDYGPSSERNTSHTLPFGAFPGSAKYR
tara:strand:+ start:1908 stop:3041 length:1134 start_codon:yes stop_codon:yes gene_type:complete